MVVSIMVLFPGAASATVTATKGLHVSKNRLRAGNGKTVSLHGVNHAGTEYLCLTGLGIFEGPTGAAAIKAMVSWHVNFVRLPINEDCWLGINGIKPSVGGARYRKAIVKYVARLHQHHIYPEVALSWAAPGRNRASTTPPAPDESHSPAVWRSLGVTFRHDPNVILAPWSEPTVTASCFLNGGMCAMFGDQNRPYRVAGMQQAVHVMRSAGYRGVIAIPGLIWANDMAQWLAYEPRDPRHQLIAEAHVYGDNACSASVSCMNDTMALVARRVPEIFGEVGETYHSDATTCASTQTKRLLRWADAHHVGYAAWTWNTWGTCLSLIKNYNGTPTDIYGAFVKAYYAAHWK
jgi:hypothetical protein